ncbi:MAG: formimidoylglutamate deiminase [Gammaproteobacteria bacterium]|nr:formimidoylglutamate deiminase [Gammaproteobacteria bacterium]MDH4314010.1 formimidoylglutamate deiminase [Gammaproteobacteria bacterium]MDH5214934.1 formimidoylglutamate deiminase [Gammaproteobacteria bacterium]
MTAIFARKALLADGWHEQVRLQFDRGRITAIERGVIAGDAEYQAGIVIPGLANAHSHAFQRALAGHTESRSPKGKDNFWTWRNRMYALAGRVDASRMKAIARQAYIEMLCSGYTSVAEFHYLHNEPGEKRSGTAMLEAIVDSATESGIRLTYVPVLYERAGFEEPQPTAEQRRFASNVDEFLQHYSDAASFTGDTVTCGIGAHSLRAVTRESLDRIAAAANRDGVPMHIHIAEQRREVEQCLAVHDRRPVEWLLENYQLDSNWCLVHATHMDTEETQALARTGAVVCLCPSTEANLGDGLFRLQDWMQQGGHIAIGSDSHISINPFEELRWLEYGQRLITEQRNIAALSHQHTGRNLFESAAAGGALATGQDTGRLEKGAMADLVVLDDESPMLAGHGIDSILDALVFSGFTLPIDRVMVHGEWQVVNGRHRAAQAAGEEYVRVVRDLLRETEADR